ncbi:MAG: hypothetical protein M1834_003576 [Cirrosporium novae-zelandiae]|nr:MAG: hypothetical protein M1834_003576 [Cirrosporium novae-zelandiae]
MASTDKIPTSLFLLPTPPSPIDSHSIHAAYSQPLEKVLDDLSTLTTKASCTTVLDIAVKVPSLDDFDHIPRAFVYEELQSLLSHLYKLFCTLCVRKSINTIGPRSVDVRIILIQSALDPSQENDEIENSHRSRFGPIVDLPVLLLSGRVWQQIYAVESESGEALLQTFLQTERALLRRNSNFRRVPGGISMTCSTKSQETAESKHPSNIRRHFSVAVGGTFDHLHIGHKLLLTCTALLLEPEIMQKPTPQRLMTIGITGDELLKNKKYAALVESWSDRQKAVMKFLDAILDFRPSDSKFNDERRISEPEPNGKRLLTKMGRETLIDCVEISDPFGPTITDETISALVVSAETRSGGKAVNDKRTEKGWPTLEVFEVDVLDAEEADEKTRFSANDNFQSKISSTEIRRQLAEKQIASKTE